MGIKYNETSNSITIELDAKTMKMAFNGRDEAISKVKPKNICDFMKALCKELNVDTEEYDGITRVQHAIDECFLALEENDSLFLKYFED